MRLDINLASQRYEDARQFWMRWGTALAATSIVTLALLVVTISGLLNAHQDRRKISALTSQIEERDRERVKAETFLNQASNRSTRDKSQFLNELIQRKMFSWTKVFEELERVMPPKLHVVSIHPDLTGENQLEIKMVVAGESRDRALDLTRKMESSHHFEQTQVTDETQQTGQNPSENVQFGISAVYVPEKSRSTP